MSQDLVILFGREALVTTFLLAGPLLVASVLVGLLISIFQATTQIQEQTLTFVPKIAVILGGLVVFGPWMLNIIIGFAENILLNLHLYTFIR
ncbi:MAG: flagellar biosynthesis protein FliQ [Clostridia bacterium]|nr:flagellar biosynthesis protein FliQ [Clostridia bacterium]